MPENLTVIVASEASAVILLDARSRYNKMSMGTGNTKTGFLLENGLIKFKKDQATYPSNFIKIRNNKKKKMTVINCQMTGFHSKNMPIQ